MLLFSILFLCGILLLQKLTHLPSLYWLAGINTPLIAHYLCFKKFRSYLKFLLPIALGFSWALWHAHMQLSWTLPAELEGKPLQITGMITTIPDREPHHTSFRFLIKKIQYENKIASVNSIVQLSWQTTAQKLHVGDQWQLTVRLKKIHGLMNPGGFDYETWSFQEGIRASGYVVSGDILLNSKWYHHPLDRIREFFSEEIRENLSRSLTSPWITALAIGERQGIPLADWQVLKNTGTNHLMAIAGLHIGFMAAFVYGAVNWLWRRRPQLILKIPAQQAGASAALLMAFIYSAMAGFSIPTQRACLMLSLFLMTLLLRRKILSWQTWGIALFCVLLCNPLSVLTASFWLSFGSVALIIYGMRGRLAPQGLWWKHGRIQSVIALGLIPLSIWLFQQCSLVSFIANSIAIPCVGFLIVPLVLLGCFLLLFSAKIGGMILYVANKILALLWMVLAYLAHFSWASWYEFVPSIWYIVTACVGMVILLLPAGFPGRWLGIIWLLPSLLYKPPAPSLGEVWFTLLDVGQGLSAVVQTKNHLLVFDAGPRLSVNHDMGENVVVPFLRSLAVTHIDRLVISHGDNDHIGGAYALLKEFPTYLVKSSVPEKFLDVPASYCLRGETWQWDQVTFEFLYPTPDKLGLDNDSSCVLRITGGRQHILLTGDIEKLAETDLVHFVATDLAADILVAPHHGSNTSALKEFILTVHPQIVLFPVGYRNPYHFPHPAVLQRYCELGIVSYDTVQAGAIQFRLSKMTNTSLNPLLYRENHKHYWKETNMIP